jgi:hypothetical protein
MMRLWMRRNRMDPGTFAGKLLIAYSLGTEKNRAKLGAAFPFIALAYLKYENLEDFSMSYKVEL